VVGCCVVLGLFVLAGVGVYIVAFHTAIPAEMMVKALNENPNVDIQGVSGSLSSGFAVETIRIKDSDGNTNELDDVRFRYEAAGDLLVIRDINVTRAHLFANLSPTATSKKATAKQPAHSSPPPFQMQQYQEMQLRVDRISINDITIQDLKNDKKLALETISLSSLALTDSLQLGDLLIKSQHCEIKATPIDPVDGRSATFALEGRLDPELHADIKKAIDFKGTFDGSDKNRIACNLTAFAGNLKLTCEDDTARLTAPSWNLQDYLKGTPALGDLDLSLSGFTPGQPAPPKIAGRFRFGQAQFTLQPNTAPTLDELKELVATAKQGDTTYRITLIKEGGMTLSSSPETTPEKTMGTLLFGRTFDELNEGEKKQVQAQLEFFTAPGGKEGKTTE
jgi:autotransporter translocation and assembly factor TamB